MKIILRTLIIVAVIAAVSGLTYLIFNNSSSTLPGSGEERPAMEQSGSLPGGSGNGFGGHQGGGPGGHGGSTSTAGLLLNFGKVAVVSMIVMAINLFINLIGKKKARQTMTV